jgi:hypothetical protein
MTALSRPARLLPILAAGLLAGCTTTAVEPPPTPAVVDRLMAQFQAEPVANPPRSIWRYDFQGRVVYYVPPACCDIPSALYEADGTVVCSPDGGMTGRGDGRCPTFFEDRRGEALVWRDSRG